ncbi:MAG TPA: hypothetical protein VJ782_01350, partial [Aeromicrobium sp.]|nr:hypothetical protein [Aeromicrobium sp.]
RASGPPDAGGTLASYVDPKFVQANVALIDNPDAVIRIYSDKFIDGIRDRVILAELVAGLIGGAVLFLIVPRRRLREIPSGQVAAAAILLVASATAVSTAVAVQLFRAWPCSHPTGVAYAMPDVDKLSFGSPETLEVAQQVKPFTDKNLERIRDQARDYEQAAQSSLVEQLEAQREELTPRDDETLIAAEADPQGSFVGVRVRRHLYAELVELLGSDAISMRTISGDVSSNGTIAESEFVAQESRVSPRIPTVASGGDHDSHDTWQQMKDGGIVIPDLQAVKVSALRVAGANDRERKSLFGGIITNPSGVSEQELGARLRARVGSGPHIVLLHQPDAAAAYLGLPSLGAVRSLNGSRTEPYDDGIPDQPPGIVNIGHLHESDGPWVLWNTGGREITWTVVDQLGTSGGVENRPTVNKFSTPTSAPLKPLSVRLQFVNTTSRLQTGYVTISCDTDGDCTVSDRVDVGLPGGQPEVIELPKRDPTRHWLDPANWPTGDQFVEPSPTQTTVEPPRQ